MKSLDVGVMMTPLSSPYPPPPRGGRRKNIYHTPNVYHTPMSHLSYMATFLGPTGYPPGLTLGSRKIFPGRPGLPGPTLDYTPGRDYHGTDVKALDTGPWCLRHPVSLNFLWWHAQNCNSTNRTKTRDSEGVHYQRPNPSTHAPAASP